ncbi:MAG TPA: suppressor of fused domain protein [Mycobacterium sp.]
MTDDTADLRARLRAHFALDPDIASVTFVGLQPIDVLRFGPDDAGITHFVSVGGSRHFDEGPPTEVVMRLRATSTFEGLARSVAVLAASPAVEGVVLGADALVDLGQPLWRGAPFTAVLLGDSGIGILAGVKFLEAIPITANEAAWVRLKGGEEMRQAWRQDGVDVLDPGR